MLPETVGVVETDVVGNPWVIRVTAVPLHEGPRCRDEAVVWIPSTRGADYGCSGESAINWFGVISAEPTTQRRLR